MHSIKCLVIALDLKGNGYTQWESNSVFGVLCQDESILKVRICFL